MAGFIAPFLLYAAMLLLHVLLPSRQVQGYVLDPPTGWCGRSIGRRFAIELFLRFISLCGIPLNFGTTTCFRK